ncbi:MAG: D-Ala-D-Ala carboxypeptidase family metallohydrolase, partial [Halanaerobiales bacterium]
IQYLNKVAKDINIAIKTNTYESDSDTLIWDNYVIQDAMVQFNQWKIFEKEAIEEYAEEYNINKAETINDAIELENPTDHKKYNYIAFYDIINSIKAKLNNWLEEEMSKDEGDRVLKTDSIYFDPKVPDIQRHFIVETYGFRPEYNYGFNLPIMNSKNREYILNIIETYGKNYDINEHLLRTPLLTHKPAPTLMVYIANNTTPTDNEQSLYIVPEIFNMIHNEVVDEGQEALKKREDAENVVHKGEDIYKWNVIDFNNINVQNIGVSLSNKVVPININMQTKPTHQYLGSKNITISIDFITRDTNDIQKINALVDHVKEMQLRYGEIINSPLLKFNNSLVEIFNIDGVEIRDLNVNTVPNFPGARMVQLTLIGYYKPSKDFESLSRIFKTEASEVLRFNMKIDKASSQDDIENLFSIKERMAKINLYPDLELPKYCELPENIPYLYQEFNEKYVDPDFYALNIDRLFTEETFKVLNIEEYQDSELHISDSSGDQLDVEIDDAGIPRNNHFVGQYDISEINVEDLISESPEWPSKHFTQDQFDEASSVWPIEMTDSFRELLVGLDILKTIIGKEININSAVRSREHNRRVNGAERSRHLIDYYCAVDICVEGYTSEQLMKIVEDLNIFTGRGLYPYSNTGYIHVDTRNGLKGLSNIVRWYEDESGSLQIAGRDYDPEKDGPFNGYVKKVSWEGPSPLEGDRNLYGDASDSSARIISEKTEEIYNKYNPTVREKFEKGNMFEVKKLLDDFNFDGFYINKETAILAAVILSQWDSELIEGDEFIFPGDRIAFNLPEAALDQYKDWQKKMNIPHESTQLFVESSLKLQALVLAGYAEKYYQKYYPIIEENDDINWLNANRDRDKINRLIAISKILSYMHCYGITLENIARPDPNYINFMEDFKKYYIELDVHGFIVTDVFDDEEIQSLNNHLSSLARDILEEADNAGEDFTYLLDADEITDVVGKYKGDNIVLRDKEERFKDSFHDMMKYDKRGRLIRAFPTYYLMLIDEGKDLWIWKLQDLFYDYHGVESIDLVRSQENIADSCVIKMSNQSNHLSDATGGYKKVRVDYGFWQTILSIFPFDDYNIEKLKREQEFKSVQLQTGARLHLRMGYGSNPLSLPTVFNGTITELQLGDQINLIAQNDGIELNKPMDYAPKTTNNKQGIGITEEPKEIITDILGDRGGIWATFWRGVTTNLTGDNKPWIYEDNVHGIRHLGALARPDWWSQYRINKRHIKNDAIHDDAKNHEISQNIYDSNRETDGEDLEHIEIALFMYGKTPWDIIQTCSMASPNYVSYIHPFSIGRNTIFYGHPTFDLAYDYEKVNSDDSLGEDDKYQESIKTFRQMHIYGSFYDIISNNIKASSKNIYTAVKPVMSDFEGDTRKLDTLYLDTDIYPEYQKQISIDTSLKVPGLFRTIGQAINLVQEIEGNAARRFGANALKQFVNTMYQGNINVLGDPSVKPYDYSYLYDMENQMNGMFEVNTVVQTMSKDTGFITSISPNPITVINKGIKRDLEYFMWATSRMGTVYRTFFTIRALIAALARSVKVGNINLVSLVQKMAINTARNFGESAMGLASRANNATNQMLKILADFEHKGLNPSKWETFKASKWGARMEVVRDGIDDSIKYIVNYTDDAKDVAQYIKYAKLGLQYSDEAAGVAHAYAKASRFKTALAYVLKYGDDIVSILTGPIGIATKMFIEHIVFTLATRFLQRKRENREVITMMLLNKNGEPSEAGIEGHKGCVLGDRPSKIDELVNSDLINFFIGVNQSQRMRSQLSNSINESYEELETDVRDLTQNAYAATYADNESTLYDYEKTMEIYREDVKRRYNEQAGFLNDLETDDENVAWDISDIKIFDDRNDWIIKACDSVNRDRDILDEYENTEMTLHPDLIFLLERIRDKNIPFSLKSESPLYTNLNNCGLGITIKVDYEDDMQRMVDTLLNSNVKSFHFFDNNSVHIDLGPHNLKNPLSDIAIDKEIFWNPGSPVREVVSINDPRQYNIFKHRTRGMLDRSN